MPDSEFRDLSDFLLGLELPYRGKTYTVPPVTSAAGLRLQAVYSAGFDVSVGRAPRSADKAALDDEQESQLYRDSLGPVFDELMTDAVPWVIVKHFGLTAFFDTVANREMALLFWNRPPGKATGPTLKPLKAAATSTAAASTTKRRASGSGTRSRKAS